MKMIPGINPYSGIGSRETPGDILKLMKKISNFLYKLGFTLRSGHSDRADKAFEEAVKYTRFTEIYLPWKGFNGGNSNFDFVTGDALKIAAKYHPIWDNLKLSSKSLLGRNVYIILGWRLDNPSKFVVCYTIDGKDSGGTGHSIRIAKDYDIPIYNLFYKDVRENIFKILKMECAEK